MFSLNATDHLCARRGKRWRVHNRIAIHIATGGPPSRTRYGRRRAADSDRGGPKVTVWSTDAMSQLEFPGRHALEELVILVNDLDCDRIPVGCGYPGKPQSKRHRSIAFDGPSAPIGSRFSAIFSQGPFHWRAECSRSVFAPANNAAITSSVHSIAEHTARSNIDGKKGPGLGPLPN